MVKSANPVKYVNPADSFCRVSVHDLFRCVVVSGVETGHWGLMNQGPQPPRGPEQGDAKIY